jgi:hemerythrin-like domain-containing protein
MDDLSTGRRDVIAAALGMAGLAGPALAAPPRGGRGPGQEKETPAVEDLMREHGVLRRALLVYRETAPRLRNGPARFDARPLGRAAQVFRSFGEDYHERKLEEAYIFPAVKRAGGPAAGLVDILHAQHDRGRQVTEYVIAATRNGSIGAGQAEPLARALEAFVLMYENHAAREDTVVFPAWKTAISERQLDELGEEFEEIERRQFGRDGYEDAVRQMAAIEQAYGLADLGQFTAPPPPGSSPASRPRPGRSR